MKQGRQDEDAVLKYHVIILVIDPLFLLTEPGKLEFAKPSLVVKESYYTARIPVNRVNGCDGHVSVKWKTTDITAKEGIDYKGQEGVLIFDNQEISRTIDIPLYESKVISPFTDTAIHRHVSSLKNKQNLLICVYPCISVKVVRIRHCAQIVISY